MNSKTLLVLSLAANVVLLAALGWFARNRPAAQTAPAAVVNSVATAALPQSAAGVAETTPTASTRASKPVQPFDWRLVESDDYKKYIANLRSIGCPEETIRDIIAADVTKLFASRKRELSGQTNKFEFWKTGNMFTGMLDEEKMKQSQELAKEKRALLKELLGTEPEEKPDLLAGMNPFESMLDFLPAAKQAEVAELYQKYQMKMAKTFSGGTPDADDMKKLLSTQKELEGELGKVLSPQEYEDYQLRLSQTAMMMRFQLNSFEPNEQEFRDIFKLKKGFDDEFGSFGMLLQDKAEKAKYDAAQKEMNSQLKTLLGDTRYEDYTRAQDWEYQGIYRVAERNGLGKEAANQVYEMKKLAQEQAVKVRQDSALSAEQRTAALQGIRTETENSIRTVLGDKGWQSYQKQPNVFWLNNISPEPKSN